MKLFPKLFINKIFEYTFVWFVFNQSLQANGLEELRKYCLLLTSLITDTEQLNILLCIVSAETNLFLKVENVRILI